MNGAIPALRGYRKQFLYTLRKILADTDGKYIFQPEGKEDLDVLDTNNNLISIHQVKAYSKPLTYIDIETFVERATHELSKNSELTASLISFGNYGKELEGVKNSDEKSIVKLTTKLEKSGFSKPQIELILNKIEWVNVSEELQYQEIIEFLDNSPLVAGHSETAFQLLVYWVYLAAENRHLISHSNLVNQLQGIGQWVTERELHHQEWNVSIKQLKADTPTTSRKQKLQNEIDEGIAVNYQHIVSSVDIERPDWLAKIHHAFHDKNVVIVHGASGQGKSALAYRYIYDYLPQDWAFQIHALDDRKRALQIATALTGYTHSLQVPVFLYIDVSPKDEGWSELIIQLSSLRNIKVLVTIREEDWRRASFDRASFSFEELLLEFNKNEAEKIYQTYHLLQSENNTKFLDFEDIWNRFGGDGPLLEFTYLLKRHETLHARLKSQISHIQQEVDSGNRPPDELKLLKLVAVAGSYEARLDLKKVASLLDLPTPARTIDLLEEEYLLRKSTDTAHLQGLHSIRSRVMSEILLDEVLDPWEDAALLCLPLIASTDMQQFLLNAFVEHISSRKSLVNSLESMEWDNWTVFGGAGKALIWLGVRSYVDKNKALFDEVFSIFGDAYWFVLDFDLVGILENDLSSELLSLFSADEDKRQLVEEFKFRQIPTNQAFDPFKKWISNVIPPISHCKTDSDYKLAGQLAYWTAHVESHKSLSHAFDLNDYTDETLKNVAIHSLGDFIFGLWHLYKFNKRDDFDNWYLSIKKLVDQRYQFETRTVFIEQEDDWIRTHFIVPLEGGDKESENKDFIHNRTMSTLNLLSQLAPRYNKYCSQGYGHNIFPLEYDPTVKNVKSPLMAPDWVVEVNMVFRILTGHEYRPPTWQEYISDLIDARRAILGDLQTLTKILTTYFRKHKPISVGDKLFDKTKTYFHRMNRFPLEALDPWGYSEERSTSTSSGEGNLPVSFSAGLLRFEDYLEFANDYRTGVNNFTNQSPEYLAVNAHMGRAKSPKKRAELKTLASSLNIDLSQTHLPVLNLFNAWKSLELFQQNFKLHFLQASGLSESDLIKLEKEEQCVFESVWCLWFTFINHPERKWNSAEKMARKLFIDTKNSLLNRLKKSFAQKLDSGVKVSIINESLDYEGATSLWLMVESDNLVDTFICLEEVHQKLKWVAKGIKSHSLEYYVWEKHWKNVVVLPLAKGKLLQAQAWCLPSYSFMQLFGADELSWTNRIMRPLPLKTINTLGLSVWDKSLLDRCNKFFESIVTVQQYLLHYLELENIPEIEDKETEIVQAYLSETQGTISSQSQEIIDSCEVIFNIFNELEEEEQLEREDLLGAVQLLSESYKNLFPRDDLDGELQLSFDDFKNWSESLASVMDKMLLVCLFWSMDIIEDTY